MTLRVSRDSQRAAAGVAVWAPDGSGTVELAHLAGPVHGSILAPVHLLGGPAAEPVWDLDDVNIKIRLYETCLNSGGPYDIYRYVNLGELLRLWPALRLPHRIVEIWERAIRQAGLASLVAERESGDGRLAG
ncbi:MAG TPA: hypothetical protein VHC49_22000 [Mycobacteriales bacterium]|nr:hypothetical protein [Mycobacteriales bacterium]